MLAPFGQRHDPYFIFGFHFIFYIVKGATFHGELVGVSGFLFLNFCMGGIFLSASYRNCCPQWAMIRCTVNPLLFKEREAPNPQALGCACDALSGA